MIKRRSRSRGGSALEMSFLMPWFLFLFVGAFDWGYYSHALISVESAARVAAVYASTNTAAITDGNACVYALEELRIVPNVGSATTCSGSPVTVTSSAATGPDGNSAAQVTVTYTTLNLIPIPGLLKPQATFYRAVEMPLRSN